MSLYKKFGGDKGLETSGIEINYGKNERTGKDIIVRIARSGGSNTKFASTMEKVMKPYRAQLKNNLVEPQLFRSLLAEVYANSVVLGWSEMDDEDGNPLPFTPENCKKVLVDLGDVFADIQEVADNASAFRKVELEADAKNSETPSSTV